MSKAETKEEPAQHRPRVAIIDITEAMEAGATIKVGKDLTIGSVNTGPQVEVKPKFLREVKLYLGEPPQGSDGKVPMQFQIQERCGLKDDAGKCSMKLIVARVKNAKFETDENRGGGQLIYDEKDVHQYIYCPKHGPFPAGPNHW